MAWDFEKVSLLMSVKSIMFDFLRINLSNTKRMSYNNNGLYRYL